jgi:hypothetical protein
VSVPVSRAAQIVAQPYVRMGERRCFHAMGTGIVQFPIADLPVLDGRLRHDKCRVRIIDRNVSRSLIVTMQRNDL